MGLSKATADMKLIKDIGFDPDKGKVVVWMPIPVQSYLNYEKWEDNMINCMGISQEYIDNGFRPAWSLHRLMMFIDFNRFMMTYNVSIEDLYDDIIAHIQSCIHLGYIKEEYLNMDIVNANEEKNMELLKNGGK